MKIGSILFPETSYSQGKSFKAITTIPGWYDTYTTDKMPKTTDLLYHVVPVAYRALQIRCDSLAGVPVKITRPNEEVVEWPFIQELNRLIWLWEASMLQKGACFGEMIPTAGGAVYDVEYRNPFDMEVDYQDGIIEFRQSSYGATWTNNLKTGELEMFYLNEYDPMQDILPGVGAAEAALSDIRLLFALSKFPENYFEGGAMPVTLLGVDTNDPNEIERTEKFFKRQTTKLVNAFRILAIRAGAIDPKQLTPPLKDLAMPELQEMAKKNVGLAFGIPLTLLDSQAANYATKQEDRLSFYEEVIKPRARMFESAINKQLLKPFDLKIYFAFEEMAIFQEDEADRATVLEKLINAGMPLRLAVDIAGYKLREDEYALLEDLDRGKQEAREQDQEKSEIQEELRKWQRMAEKRFKDGKPFRDFKTDIIPEALSGAINGALMEAGSVQDIKAIFAASRPWEDYP